jgi:hypothetical protein
MVLHVDAYMAGAHSRFEGSETYIIACCGVCTFGALEPITGANATTFASAIMISNFDMDSATPSSLTRIQNSSVYAGKPLTC